MNRKKMIGVAFAGLAMTTSAGPIIHGQERAGEESIRAEAILARSAVAFAPGPRPGSPPPSGPQQHRDASPPGDSHLRSEAVRIATDGATIEALLILPNFPGAHPAVVLIPNTFPDRAASARDLLRRPAEAYASRGVAALVYDRRGWHGSTGDPAETRFDVMAADALAAVDALSRRADIDSGRVGVSGYSNSGWTATLAASRNQHIAFIVNMVCAPFAPWQVDLSRVQTQMRGDGFSERDVDRATEYMQVRFEVGRTGEGWARLEALRREIETESWFNHLDHDDTLVGLRRHWQDHLSYDPASAWRGLQTPVLVVYAEFDWNFRLPECLARTRSLLAEAGNSRSTIEVVPKADHLLRVATTGGRREFQVARPLAPGVWDMVLDWVIKRTSANRP